MAIRTDAQGKIPSIDLEFLHFDHFQFSTSRRPPYTTSLSSKFRFYGVSNDDRYYSDKNESISIGNIDSYVAGLDDERKQKAIQAIGSIQLGLGILVEINKDIKFKGVE